MDILNKSDKEQDFQFNRSEIWLDLEDIDEEFEEVLKPHSLIYTNRLRPMWLFNLKNIQKLGFFDYVLARDGAMGITKFFNQFSEPSGIQTKILIHTQHYRLIPEEWRDNVILYSNKRPNETPRKDNFLMCLSGHQYVASESDLEETLNMINSNIKPQKLTVLPLNLKIRGLETAKQGEAYLSKLISCLIKNSKCEIEFISIEDLSSLDLNGVGYINLNPMQMMYSESYVDYMASAKGGVNFKSSEGVTGEAIKVGPKSYVEVVSDWPSDYSSVRQKIKALIGDNRSELLLNERADDVVPVFFNAELYSYVDWVNSL